jgi:RHS repeat-associated protein
VWHTRYLITSLPRHEELFAELAATGVDRVEYSYYPGLDRLHAVSAASDTVYFAHQDGLGSVIGLVNHQNNQLRASYWYDRWGKQVTETENLGAGARNRARFKGAMWMGDYGPELYYMRHRWYEPHSGRFLSEDPIGLDGGINPFIFAANDPVGGRDPVGLRSCKGGVFDDHYDFGEVLVGWDAVSMGVQFSLHDCDEPGGMADDFPGLGRGREPSAGPRRGGGLAPQIYGRLGGTGDFQRELSLFRRAHPDRALMAIAMLWPCYATGLSTFLAVTGTQGFIAAGRVAALAASPITLWRAGAIVRARAIQAAFVRETALLGAPLDIALESGSRVAGAPTSTALFAAGFVPFLGIATSGTSAVRACF